VIREANANEYLLAASAWTLDFRRAMRVAKRLRSGMVAVNTNGGPSVLGPFGGSKISGLGRELSMHGLELYPRSRTSGSTSTAERAGRTRPVWRGSGMSRSFVLP